MIYFISPQTFIETDQVKMATIEDLKEYVSKRTILSCDIETSGLHPIYDKLLVLAIGDQKDQYVLDCLSHSPTFLYDAFASEGVIKLFHNSKFDYKFLTRAGLHLDNVHCTFLGEEILTKGKNIKSNSLDSVLERVFRVSMSKGERNSFIGMTSGPLSIDQVMYAAKDVQYLEPLYMHQLQRIRSLNLQNVMRVENEAALAMADMELNGFGFDKAKWLKLAQTSRAKEVEIGKELDEIILTDPLFEQFRSPGLQLDMFTPQEELRKVDVLWSSPAQVKKIFQRIDPDIEGVGVDELSPIAHKHPIIKTYLKHGELRKMAGAYGTDFFKYLDPDGRIRTNFTQIVSTGRVSSSNPNMQQIPAKETVVEVHGDQNAYRSCFIPGYEDYVFVSADYSSQELALIAHNSQDPVWLEALEKGQDLHSVAAEIVYGQQWEDAALPDCAYYKAIEESQGDVLVKTLAKAKCKCPEHKHLRTAVKTINFGLAYGMSAQKLSSKLSISLQEAEALITKYFKVFPSIEYSLNKAANFGVANGYIRTMPPFGRIRWFSNWYLRSDKQERGKIERRSKNTEIQGSGADMTKYAAGKLRRLIHRKKYPVMLIMKVHDQIDTIAHKDFALEWKQILQRTMEEAALAIIPSGLLKAEAEISDHWKK